MSRCTGTVPARKNSSRVSGVNGDGNRPDSASISCTATVAGCGHASAGWPSSAADMNRCQIGAAPRTPVTSSIGVPSALPTHTPATNWGV